MVSNRRRDQIKVKDQLGRPEDIAIFGPFRKNEDVFVEEGPVYVIQPDLTDVARWDDADTTWDGPDLNDEWLDYTRSDVKVVAQVWNRNNTFIDRFLFSTTTINNDNLFGTYSAIDTTNTTATVDVTTNNNVTFTSGQVLQYESVFKDTSASPSVVVAATLTVTSSSGSFDFELSADGGSNWESVTNGTTHTFTNTGSDLRIRITENAASTGTITLIRCNYNI